VYITHNPWCKNIRPCDARGIASAILIIEVFLHVGSIVEFVSVHKQ
jgi:hypothetical protein